MNTSFTMMSNYSDLIKIYKEKTFGNDAGRIRDHFALDSELNEFDVNKYEILRTYLDEDERAEKAPRCITLKQATFERLQKISALLGTSDSQTCRLVVRYFADKNPSTYEKVGIKYPRELEEELAKLKRALEQANESYRNIIKYYEGGHENE
ncbi:hypothetical protein [Butyrivibrio sp. AC2005]|uniref:hypothetical protein n=1 Tax=Butyrivibrio sp. AC2005 TaxID=1280672 RepID=UPI00041D3A43|nr:hypothetical protein [Butyrivibrio sp. AC2005]